MSGSTLPAIDESALTDLSTAKILLVDDNQQNLELMQAYLETLPCKLATARDGLEAIEAIQREKPDLVLLDVMMPKMSGFEVCQRLKSDPATSPIMILMVTALGELGDIERAVDAGTDDFLSKPVNRVELVKRVENMLKLRHVSDELERLRSYIRTMDDDQPPR